MAYFYFPDCNPHSTELPDEESRHALKSLRLSMNSEIRILNGKGKIYHAKIASVGKRGFTYEIYNEEIHKAPSPSLHIAISTLKSVDRFEWFAEKATELGVASIQPLICQRTFKKSINLKRLERIVISAIKQSGNPFLPVLHPPKSLDELLNQALPPLKYIGYCEDVGRKSIAEIDVSSPTLTLIGPEGDFSPEEFEQVLSAGFEPISMGPLTLRAETAAVAFCVHFQFQNS